MHSCKVCKCWFLNALENGMCQSCRIESPETNPHDVKKLTVAERKVRHAKSMERSRSKR